MGTDEPSGGQILPWLKRELYFYQEELSAQTQVTKKSNPFV
jgi:hypothetical protein